MEHNFSVPPSILDQLNGTYKEHKNNKIEPHPKEFDLKSPPHTYNTPPSDTFFWNSPWQTV